MFLCGLGEWQEGTVVQSAWKSLPIFFLSVHMFIHLLNDYLPSPPYGQHLCWVLGGAVINERKAEIALMVHPA